MRELLGLGFAGAETQKVICDPRVQETKKRQEASGLIRFDEDARTLVREGTPAGPCTRRGTFGSRRIGQAWTTIVARVLNYRSFNRRKLDSSVLPPHDKVYVVVEGTVLPTLCEWHPGAPLANRVDRDLPP